MSDSFEACVILYIRTMRSIGLAIIVLIIGSGLFSACSDNIEKKQTGDIVGAVSDRTTGEPIPTVNVALYPGGELTLTGSDGNYMFTDLKEGTYTIILTKEGYSPADKTLEVKAGEQTNGFVLLNRIPAVVTVDRDSLAFGDGSDVNSLSFNIVNSGYEDLEWNVEYDCDWIREIKDTEGVLPYGKTQTIVIFIDRELLMPGYNKTNVVVRSSNGSSDIKVTAIGKDRDDVVLNMSRVSDVMKNSATLTGLLINEGIPKYEELGFVCSTEPMPTIDGAEKIVTVKTTYGSGDEFVKKVETFSPGTTYYVRPYARTSKTTYYSSNELSFQTIREYSKIRMDGISGLDVLSGKVTFNASILDAGIPSYVEKGFCYSSESASPTVDDETVSLAGSDTGEFSSTVYGLEMQKIYSVRPYVRQNGNVLYGESCSFSMESSETSVTTSSVSDISFASAVFNGIVDNEGIPPYSEKGFCYSQNPDPDVRDGKIVVEGEGSGSYSCRVDGLEADTQYYVKAYAIQNGNIKYGEAVSFVTEYRGVSITTLDASEVDISYAIVNADISSVGLPPYSERGFCYSPYPNTEPTVDDRKISVPGSGTAGKYSARLQALDRKTRYYVKAYAVQGSQVFYGKAVDFTTVWENSSVLNKGCSNQRLGSIDLNALINNPGYPLYTEHGFVCKVVDAEEWMEQGGPEFEPTVSDTKLVQISAPAGDGSYTHHVTGLNGMKVCGYRPYLIQGGDVIYGETSYFLFYYLPEVVTKPVGVADGDPSRIQINGFLEWPGNPEYTEVGFAVSTSESKPEIDKPGVKTVKPLLEQGAAFAGILTDIPQNVIVYIRAYAKSPIGVSYGSTLFYINGQ